MGVSLVSRLKSRVQTFLAPRQPHVGIYTVVIVPVVLISSLTVSVSLLAVGTTDWRAVVGPPAITILALAVSQLVMLTWVWIVPRAVYSARSLALSTWASYAPFILAGLSGGWTALWLRELGFSDQEAIPFQAVAAIMALTTLIFTTAGLLTNHLARMLERQRAHERELARRLVELGSPGIGSSRPRSPSSATSPRRSTAGSRTGWCW